MFIPPSFNVLPRPHWLPNPYLFISFKVEEDTTLDMKTSTMGGLWRFPWWNQSPSFEDYTSDAAPFVRLSLTGACLQKILGFEFNGNQATAWKKSLSMFIDESIPSPMSTSLLMFPPREVFPSSTLYHFGRCVVDREMVYEYCKMLGTQLKPWWLFIPKRFSFIPRKKEYELRYLEWAGEEL